MREGLSRVVARVKARLGREAIKAGDRVGTFPGLSCTRLWSLERLELVHDSKSITPGVS